MVAPSVLSKNCRGCDFQSPAFSHLPEVGLLHGAGAVKERKSCGKLTQQGHFIIDRLYLWKLDRETFDNRNCYGHSQWRWIHL
jgi:hypothetical protein